jgi:anti-anti-sigma factor
VEHDQRRPAVVVPLSGELDLSRAEQLRRVLMDACQQTTGVVVVDLADVSFLDSTVIGVLVAAAKRLRADGHRIALVNVAPAPARPLHITQVWEPLNAHERGAALPAWVADALALGAGASPTHP